MNISKTIAYVIAFASISIGVFLYGQSTGPSVILTWDHPEPDTVTHYWIERSMRVDFRDADILGPVETTTYIDHPTTAGRTYYRVRAMGPGGQSSPSSYAQIVVVLPPLAPTNLSVRIDTE